MISLTMTLYLNPSISDIRNWYGFTTVAAKPSSVCECISGDKLVVMRERVVVRVVMMVAVGEEGWW